MMKQPSHQQQQQQQDKYTANTKILPNINPAASLMHNNVHNHQQHLQQSQQRNKMLLESLLMNSEINSVMSGASNEKRGARQHQHPYHFHLQHQHQLQQQHHDAGDDKQQQNIQEQEQQQLMEPFQNCRPYHPHLHRFSNIVQMQNQQHPNLILKYTQQTTTSTTNTIKTTICTMLPLLESKLKAYIKLKGSNTVTTTVNSTAASHYVMPEYQSSLQMQIKTDQYPIQQQEHRYQLAMQKSETITARVTNSSIFNYNNTMNNQQYSTLQIFKGHIPPNLKTLPTPIRNTSVVASTGTTRHKYKEKKVCECGATLSGKYNLKRHKQYNCKLRPSKQISQTVVPEMAGKLNGNIQNVQNQI